MTETKKEEVKQVEPIQDFVIDNERPPEKEGYKIFLSTKKVSKDGKLHKYYKYYKIETKEVKDHRIT